MNYSDPNRDYTGTGNHGHNDGTAITDRTAWDAHGDVQRVMHLTQQNLEQFIGSPATEATARQIQLTMQNLEHQLAEQGLIRNTASDVTVTTTSEDTINIDFSFQPVQAINYIRGNFTIGGDFPQHMINGVDSIKPDEEEMRPRLTTRYTILKAGMAQR